MTKKPLRVVFMGCPDFAVPSLSALASDSDFEIAAVYTMPDKPKGRGKSLCPTPVKKFALEHGLSVHTPSSFKKQPEEIEILKSYKPDYLAVAAYGLILPQAVLDIPSIAPINLHASLLPKYRGASPIHYAILNNEKETGNTVMLMSKGMDEGDMLAVSKVKIEEDDDQASLQCKLACNGAVLLPETLKKYAAGEITPIPQKHEEATYTQKITVQDAQIDWNKKASEIKGLIYAMSPCPGAWFYDGKDRIKVFKAKIADIESSEPAGTILAQDKKAGIEVVCGDSKVICLTELQRPGKNRINVSSFLCGCCLSADNLCSCCTTGVSTK